MAVFKDAANFGLFGSLENQFVVLLVFYLITRQVFEVGFIFIIRKNVELKPNQTNEKLGYENRNG